MSEPLALDNNLQLYTDSTVASFSPIKKESFDMQAEAEALEITDDATLQQGLDLRKKVVKHINSTEDRRMEYTRPLKQVTDQLIAGQRDVLAPAEDAKTIVGKKIMEYQAEQERLAAIERERVSVIIAAMTTNEAVSSKKITLIDARGAELKAHYAELSEADQNNVDIKLAFTQAINRLLEARDILSRAQVDAAEQAKAQAQRDAAELSARHEAEVAPAAAPAPKTGVRMVTKFEVTAPDAVPREYCSVNDSLIRQAIAAGTADIPGVRIYQERSF